MSNNNAVIAPRPRLVISKRDYSNSDEEFHFEQPHNLTTADNNDITSRIREIDTSPKAKKPVKRTKTKTNVVDFSRKTIFKMAGGICLTMIILTAFLGIEIFSFNGETNDKIDVVALKFAKIDQVDKSLGNRHDNHDRKFITLVYQNNLLTEAIMNLTKKVDMLQRNITSLVNRVNSINTTVSNIYQEANLHHNETTHKLKSVEDEASKKATAYSNQECFFRTISKLQPQDKIDGN